jgi:hypothetical protein
MPVLRVGIEKFIVSTGPRRADPDVSRQHAFVQAICIEMVLLIAFRLTAWLPR